MEFSEEENGSLRRTLSIAMGLSFFIGIILLFVGSSSTKMNGAYSVVNSIMTFVVAYWNLKPSFFGKEAWHVLYFSFYIPFVALIFQIQVGNVVKKMGFQPQHLFRFVVAQALELCLSYTFLKFFPSDVHQTFAFGAINAITLFSYTSLVRDSYVFYELQGTLPSVITIESGPLDVTAAAGGTATFTLINVTSSNVNDVLSYQWEKQGPNSPTWTVVSGTGITGQTTNSLTVANLVLNQSNEKYRCKVTTTTGSASLTSTEATLTVI